MAKQGGTKFTWEIKNFESLPLQIHYSDTYKIGTTGCICRFGAYPHITEPVAFGVCCMYFAPLPGERRTYFKCRLTIVNQLSEEQSIVREFHFKDGGYIVNNCVKIVVEVDILDKLDIQVEVEKINKSITMIKIEENDGALPTVLMKEEASAKLESVDINEFQVFPSQVESVKRIFERHPDVSVGFRAKNQHLRNACMSSLLGLTETLCQSLQELSNEDLVEADIALKYVKDAGFKVDWLEKKLKQVKEKKEKELSDLAMLQETGEKILKQKQKCAELEALAEKQKADLSATRTSLSLDDVI